MDIEHNCEGTKCSSIDYNLELTGEPPKKDTRSTHEKLLAIEERQSKQEHILNKLFER